MIIAWTRLFHAYFHNQIGDRFYYKKNGKFELIDGERKAWELSTCIKKYGILPEAVERNLEFFIKIRNKIEHRHIDRGEIDVLIFGECQALLYNYESLLIEFFGQQYALNEALVYSLQFSHLRTTQQQKANKSALSKDLSEISSYIEKFRASLKEGVFNAQEYSIKLLQIPKISNTNRADAAIEFVKWNELTEEDKAAYEKIAVIVKDKRVKVPTANVGLLKPNRVWERFNAQIAAPVMTQNLHAVMYKLFKIRPEAGADDPFETNPDFCLYDETHNDYIYQPQWVEFLVKFFQDTQTEPAVLREMLRNKQFLSISDYI
jgi:hypothetical protein